MNLHAIFGCTVTDLICILCFFELSFMYIYYQWSSLDTAGCHFGGNLKSFAISRPPRQVLNSHKLENKSWKLRPYRNFSLLGGCDMISPNICNLTEIRPTFADATKCLPQKWLTRNFASPGARKKDSNFPQPGKLLNLPNRYFEVVLMNCRSIPNGSLLSFDSSFNFWNQLKLLQKLMNLNYWAWHKTSFGKDTGGVRRFFPDGASLSLNL